MASTMTSTSSMAAETASGSSSKEKTGSCIALTSESIWMASGVLGSPSASTTVTLAPCSLSLRATTKPSPPLLPLPQNTTQFKPDTARSVSRIKRAAAQPAFSIRRR